jgi:hypothetical protein
MTNFLDIIHRLILINNTQRFGDWSLSPKLQSPKRCVFLIKTRRWIMSNNFVILTTHHRHKPSEFT